MIFSKNKPTYGIDAPYIIIGFVVAGISFLIIGILLRIFTQQWVLDIITIGCFLSSLYCLINAFLMLASSLYGKKRQTKYLIAMLNIQGHEAILDVGCGRGLLLIAAAKKLTTGKAIGIDIWQKADQWDNTKEQTLRNIAIERVQEKTEVIDADVRTMPFENNSFDIVMSNLVIHNLSSASEREKAIKEMIRVLKFGGKLIIQDFQYTDEYKILLQTYNLNNIEHSGLQWWQFPPVRIVMGIKHTF